MTNPYQEIPSPYEQTEQTRTPEEEQAIALTRMVHDGVIAQRIIAEQDGGIGPDGVLHPAEAHKVQLHKEAVVDPARDAYAETPEGQESAKALRGLVDIRQMIGKDYLGYAGPMGRMEDGKYISPWEGFDVAAFVAENNLTLLDSRVVEDIGKERHSSNHWLHDAADKTIGQLDQYAARLMALNEHQFLYSDYHIGSTVRVDDNWRFGNASSLPQQWRIDRILASGELHVVNDESGMKRNMSLSALDHANASPRTMAAPQVEI